uniref:Cell shape-determining protein MreC n=1 Tax=uncultured Flavobacteriia bacterium TaxID=212695 RepID=H6RHG8_9BACT|nr:rod shape-determining protein MreC [uncultured Flavobacteriia bacterium]
MRSIINSIVKNRNLIIYLTLSFITFSFLYNNSSLHFYEFGKISTYLSATSSKLSSSINSYFNLKRENEKLINENLQLKKMESKNRFTQINEDTLNSINSAKVIVNSINKSKNIIIIDKGKLDSINLEMGVISSKGVVGIVKSVTNNYASIISLLNTDLKLNAILKNSSTIGSVTWDGLNAKILKLNDIPLSTSLKVGDTVVTGGMSFYFPKGVPVGKIINYDNNSLEGYYEIDIEAFNDFSSLSNLYILNRTDNNEIQSLLDE